MTTDRIRLNLISEVALAADGAARPIHILRTGTFTGQSGQPTTFERDHIAAIVANFQAGKRRKPPITERHDWGRAVGRMMDVYSDAAGENLYALPKWNASGRQLLSEETYDGFSVELDLDEAGGFVLVGGSLTNYPAVNGLEPVTLSAPDSAPTARADTPQPTTTEVAPMSESMTETTPVVTPPAAAPPPLPPLPTFGDAAMQAQIAAYVQQLDERNRQIQAAAFAQARAEFERRAQELEQRNGIEAFARARTMTSADQAYALPCSADELTQMLLETPVAVRGKWQTLLTRITASGLVSFDEIGSVGGDEAGDQYDALVSAKMGAGMSRTEAIRAVNREHPHLYNAQSRPKGGR